MDAQAAERGRDADRRQRAKLGELDSELNIKSQLIQTHRTTNELSYQVKHERAEAQLRSDKADIQYRRRKMSEEFNSRELDRKHNNLIAEEYHKSELVKMDDNHQMNLRNLEAKYNNIRDGNNQEIQQEMLTYQYESSRLKSETLELKLRGEQECRDLLQRNDEIQLAKDRRIRGKLQNSNLERSRSQERGALRK